MNLRKLNKVEHLKLMGCDDVPDVNRNLLSLGLFDFAVPPEEITAKLGLPPESTGVKGEKYSVGPPHNRIERTYDYSFWTYTRETHSNDYVGDLADSFLREVVSPRQKILTELRNVASLQFQVVQYYYSGCNPGFGLEADHVQMLATVGASIDVDIYCLGE